LAILEFIATGVGNSDYFTTNSCTGGRIAIGGGLYDATNGSNVTLHSSGNVGSVTSNTPNSQWQIYFTLAGAGVSGDTIHVQEVCIDAPVGNSAPVTQPGAANLVRIG